MSSGFRFIQAASESFDDLEGFQVDRTGVFNGITSKYTNVIADLDGLSLKQELYETEARPAERHKKRKKRSSSSTKHNNEASEHAHICDNNRAVSAFSQQAVKEESKRRSVSAKSPSPQPNTVIHQIKKQPLVASNVHNPQMNDLGEAPADTGEKRHRKRKTRKRPAQSYGTEPTPGPLTERPNENGPSLENEDKGYIDVSPVNARNPYKQNRASNMESNGYAGSASPINRSIGSRGSQMEPFATSTPAIPDTESFHTTLPLELDNPGNNSIAESIAMELSGQHEEKNASLASELSLHDGTSMRHTSSSIKQSMHSPLFAYSAIENKSFGINVMGVSTPKQKTDSSSSLRIDTSLPPPNNVSEDTAVLKARIRQLEDEKKESLLQRIEEEKKAVILEKDMLASKLEQEKSKIADISYRIVQNSLTVSMAGDPELGSNKHNGGKMVDEDLIILGPTHNQEQEAEDVVGGDYGEGVIASIVKSPGPSAVHTVKMRETPVDSRNPGLLARKVNDSSTKSSAKSSPARKSSSNAQECPQKSKSLHNRRHDKRSISPSSSYSNSSGSKYSFSSPEMSYKHQNKHRSTHRSGRHHKNREYKYLYASIKEMEARQFELLDRIAELAKETKTVRSVGTDSMPPGTNTATPSMIPMSYVPGSIPSTVTNIGMVPIMPVIPQICMPTASGLPYPSPLQTTPLQGTFVPPCTQYPTPVVLPPHQAYLPYMMGSQSSVPVSNETAALISTVSQMIGTAPVRPSVHDTIRGIMTNYGFGK